MPMNFTCPRGHLWEGSLSDEQGAVGGWSLHCPYCGEAVEPPPATAPTSASTPGEPLLRQPTLDAAYDKTAVMPGPPPVMPRPPPTVPGYEIIGELGRGGMGVVYKARQVSLNRVVALKMILGGAHARPQHLARFRIEAEAVARLQHPNIVQVYEVGEHDGQPYLSLEFVDGGNLEKSIGGRAQPPRQAAELVETLARAMHAAHQRGVVHRDLKLGNVLLTAEGVPKITDFGLAKRLDAGSGHTRSGDVMGTPTYMAPEQAQGRTREIGPVTDVYALGIMLYELVTGRVPFEGETPVDTMLRVLEDDPVPPTRLQPRMSRDLETICLKCLEKEPKRRYATAGEFADDLRRFLNNEPIKARPIGTWERGVKWARRRPAVAALLGVSGLAVLGVLAVSLWFNVQLQAALQDARANFLRAQEQEREAKLQEERAVASAREAEQRRAIAEENLQTARAALDETLTAVGKDLLEDVPGIDERMRRRILEKAAGLYQRLASTNATDPETRRDTGLACFNLAELYRGLGHLTEAADAYLRAADMQEELSRQFPKDPRFRRDLATTCNWLGEALRLAGGYASEARRMYARARDLQQELAEQFPAVPLHRHELARSHYNLGIVAMETGARDEAGKHYQRATGLLEPLAKQFPGERDYRHDLARTHINVGILCREEGKARDAEAAYARAIELLEELRREAPAKSDYRRELAVSRMNRGNLLLLAGGRVADAEADYREARPLLARLAEDFPLRHAYRAKLANCYNGLAGALRQRTDQRAEARDAYRNALAIQEKLVAEQGDVADYQSSLGGMCDNLAALLSEEKEFAEARRRFDQALPHHRAALKANPTHPTYRQFLCNHHAFLAETLLRQRDHAGAANAAAELVQVMPERGEEQYRAAGLLALCVTVAAADPKLSDAERVTVSGEYARLALDRLREAERKGFKDVAKARTAPAFRSLQGRPEFEKWLRTASDGRDR
jgi:tetratricopeptide (TPR) repeat protein/predicted Ser/Thr protein kinase